MLMEETAKKPLPHPGKGHSEPPGSTPYDDAFRTLIVKGGSLRIPFINEMFHLKEPLAEHTDIVNIENEYYIDEGQGGQRKRITDSVLRIRSSTCHIECESKGDGTVLIRMFEYDFGIAAQESTYDNGHLQVTIPHSGVLYLRSTSSTPDHLTVIINAGGNSLTYEVAVLRLSDYSLDDLIRRDLLFLFPFYLFNLERDFKRFERNDAAAKARVDSSFEKLMRHINAMYQEEKLSAYQYMLLSNLIAKVADSLTQKYSNVRKELGRIMGGQIIEFPFEKSIKDAKEEGKAEGRAEGMAEGKAEGMAEGKAEGMAEGKVIELVGLAYEGILDKTAAAKRAKSRYGVDNDTFQKMLDSYNPEQELKQG